MTLQSVGFATDAEPDLDRELATAAAAACSELGIRTLGIKTSSDARKVDLVIGIGFPSSYRVLFDSSLRAMRVAWFGEPLPPPDQSWADAAFRTVPLGRVLDAMISVARRVGPQGNAPDRLWRWREAAAYTYDWRRNLGIHAAAEHAGIRVVVTSRDRSGSLARRGIRAPVVPFGYHRVMAGDPVDPCEGPRDIDVLFLGSVARDVRSRRARIIAAVLADLRSGTRTKVIDGGVWGVDRTALLRRAKIVLNVHRAPGNFEGVRYMVAAAAGALVISEPIADPHPFVPGMHYVEAEPRSLAASVEALLADDGGRLAIARAGQALVVNELAMGRSIEKLLDAVA